MEKVAEYNQRAVCGINGEKACPKTEHHPDAVKDHECESGDERTGMIEMGFQPIGKFRRHHTTILSCFLQRSKEVFIPTT